MFHIQSYYVPHTILLVPASEQTKVDRKRFKQCISLSFGRWMHIVEGKMRPLQCRSYILLTRCAVLTCWRSTKASKVLNMSHTPGASPAPQEMRHKKRRIRESAVFSRGQESIYRRMVQSRAKERAAINLPSVFLRRSI